MAEYTDPLMPFLLKDFEAIEADAGTVRIRTIKGHRFAAQAGTEAAAWHELIERVRQGGGPLYEEARLRLLARLIVVGMARWIEYGHETEADKRAWLIEYMRGEPWKDAVALARAILACEFAPLEHEVEV